MGYVEGITAVLSKKMFHWVLTYVSCQLPSAYVTVAELLTPSYLVRSRSDRGGWGLGRDFGIKS